MSAPEPLTHHYDPAEDVLVVEGIAYDATIFRGLGRAWPPGQLFLFLRRIEARPDFYGRVQVRPVRFVDELAP